MRALLLDIRADERDDVASAFATLVAIMAGHALLETARDALFLARLPVARLPWVYLAIAVVAFGISRVKARGPQTDIRRDLALGLATAAVLTTAMWLLLAEPQLWMLYALYIWSGLVATFVTIRFWGLLDAVFTVSQAKRLFSLIGAGSVLGALLGSGLAGLLTRTMDVRSLVLAAAAFFALAAVGPWWLRALPATTRRVSEAKSTSSLSLVWKRPYPRKVALFVLCASVTVTLVDFAFKSEVAHHVPAADLGRFLSSVYFLLNLLSLVLQLTLSGWLIRWVGVTGSLALLPFLLAFGGLGLALTGSLAAAVLLKSSDGGLRYSLHRTASELLYVPMADEMRGRIKEWVDGVGQRGGQALAALLMLAVTMLPQRERILGGSIAVLALATLVLTRGLRRHYVDLFRATVDAEHSKRRDALPELDLGALESLISGLNSPDESEVLAALDLLAAEGRTRLVPALILYHPSPAVVVRALDHLVATRRTDILPMTIWLGQTMDPAVRASALRARAVLAWSENDLRAALDDPSAMVRATALGGLVTGGVALGSEERALVGRLVTGGESDAQLALARVLREGDVGEVGFSETERLLLGLSESADLEVKLETARAMRHAPSLRYLPALLSFLAYRSVRGEARAAMAALGPSAIGFLDVACGDVTLAHSVRRHIPRSFLWIDPRGSAAVLLRHLLQEPDGMVRFKILRALGTIRSLHPDVELDGPRLDDAINATMARVWTLLDWRVNLARELEGWPSRRTESTALLSDLLAAKEHNAVERLFRLLALRYPREDLYGIFRAYRRGAAAARASGEELLLHILPSPLREALTGYLDDRPAEARLLFSQPFHEPRTLGFDALLGVVMRTRGEVLRCLTVRIVGELGLTRLAGDVSLLTLDPSPHMRGVALRALAAFSPQSQPQPPSSSPSPVTG